jgi:hypothetical protein
MALGGTGMQGGVAGCHLAASFGARPAPRGNACAAAAFSLSEELCTQNED